jgi:hypothetical protein
MKNILLNITFILLLLVMACNTQEDVLLSENIKYTNDSLTYSNVLQGVETSDEYFLKSTQREGSLLYIEVSYSGGCEMHEFNVVWDGIIYYSEPPQAYIILTHNSNNDNCEAFLTETLTIDLVQVFGDAYSENLKLIILNGSE